MAEPNDLLYERFNEALNRAHKLYWVGENFDGKSEFNCAELTFAEFRNCIADFYAHDDPRAWNTDTKKLDRDYLVAMIQNSLDGINKYRLRLGRKIDARMQEIITREADATKDSRNPKTYLEFTTTRVPSTGFLSRKYNLTYNQAAESIRAKKLGSKYTTQEWYDMYKNLHRQVYLSEQIAEELILPENAHRKGYEPNPIKSDKNKTSKPKPPRTKPAKKYNLKVYDEDTIPYPFKSKIRQYREQEPFVPFVEAPKQDRVDYDKVERPYFSNERGAWEIDHCFKGALPYFLSLFGRSISL